MEFTGLGGGIMVVLAAGLWLVYLMPSMFKRREYVSVERTEIRRQQALRVLQETAPIPAVVRAKAIVSPGGEVTDRDKLAEAITRSREAQAARAKAPNGSALAASAKARMLRRLRRTRAVATLVLLASVATIVVQASLMISSGIAVAGWGVLGFAGVVGVVSIAALARLANMARRRAAMPTVAPAFLRTSTQLLIDEPEPQPAEVVASWTPVPLPKPVYLSRSEAPAQPAVDVADQLREAALEADRALREAQKAQETTEAPEGVPVPQRREAASVSRFATMGIVDDPELATPDLDEVLRRRRRSA